MMQPRIDVVAQSARPSGSRASHDAVQAWMREHLARLLGVVPDDLDPHENFLDLGVDSVQAMALLELLATELGVALAPEVFFDHPSLAALAGHLLAVHPDEVGRRLQAPPTAPAAPTAPTEAAGAAPPGPWVEVAAPPTPPEPPQPPTRTIDIAIIGMAGRFPGAATLDAFWENIRSGVDSISDVPKDRWDIDAVYDPDPRAPNKSYLRQGGFLDDIYSFAPLFFHLSPREAAFIDPQQRLFLEIAWETIEGAGYGGASLRGTRTGVYVGVSSGEFLHAMITRQCEMASYVGTGNSPSIIPNRVSYLLNLRGPSLALDTACSSSLVAINLACQSLARGETDYALAGAVGLTLHHGKWVYFSKAGMLSVDGRCKTFDASANGYVPGEGVAAVLLKPLAAALRDRDTIHGVIRGIGVNQDGRTNGITAPSPRAQRELCQEVYERFGIDPSTISYVEAHGTGTPLGDPIEVSALTQAFGHFTDRKQFCGIGSLKTNIGHLEPVAGVAGLCKVLLAMRHRQLPPTIHFEEVNPHIHFEETPFYLVDRLQPWQADGPRRATVSAFSFGGVNAHLVVEEPPAPLALPAGQPAPDAAPAVITLAATSDTALATMAARLGEHLARTPTLRLADVAFTLNVGRDHFDRRLAFVATSLAELRGELARAGERIGGAERAPDGPAVGPGAGSGPARRRRKARQAAYLFGGTDDDGAVRAAALSLAASEPDVRGLVDEATALVGALTPETTRFVVQVALARLWSAWGLKPQAVAGVGAADALAAAVAAGALPFEAGLRRAQAGGGADYGPVEAAVPIVAPAQCTGDEYVVIRIGPDDASPRRLAEIAAEAYQAGLDLDWPAWHRHGAAGRVPLPTYPFERQVILPPPSNATGEPTAAPSPPAEPAAAGRPPAPDYLNGAQPHAVRLEAAARPDGDGRVTVTLEDRDGRVLVRLADVVLAGDLPLAPVRAAAAGAGPPALEPLPPGLLHALRWQPRPLPTDSSAASAPVGTYVLFADDRVAEPLGRALLAGGSRVIRVLPGPELSEEGPDLFRLNPASPGDHEGLVVSLQERGLEPTFVHLWSCADRRDVLGDPDLLEARLARGPYSVFALIRAISRRRLGGPPALYVGSTDGQAAGAGPVQPEHAAVFGLMRTIGQEYGQLRTVHVDLDGASPPDLLAAQLLGEIAGGAPDRSVAYRDDARLVPELAPLDGGPVAAGPRLRQSGVYWITGGLGGLGRLVARHLAERVRARLVLSGRTVPPPRERWGEYLQSAGPDDAMARVIQDVQAIEAAGGEVLILEVDSAETWQVRRAVRQAVERFGVIHGVFHAAGVLRDGLLRSKELATFREVLRPKVRGTLCLERALEGQPLDFFALFSSVAAIAGNIAQSDYATANAFLDGLAWQRSREQGRPYVALNWSLWEHGGMGTSTVVQEAARSRGIVPIDTAIGLRALEVALASGLPQVVIGQFEEKALLRGLPATGGRRETALQPATPRAVPPVPPVPNLSPAPPITPAPPVSVSEPPPPPAVPPAPVVAPGPAAAALGVAGGPPPDAPVVPPAPAAPWRTAPDLPADPAAAAPAPTTAAPASAAVAAGLSPDPSDDPGALHEFAEDWLLGLVGSRLGVAIGDLDPETPFLDLGIDSIIAGEVALDAGSQLPVALSPTMLLDYPTFAELAGYLCQNHPDDVRELRQRLGKGPKPAAPVAPLAPAGQAGPQLAAPVSLIDVSAAGVSPIDVPPATPPAEAVRPEPLVDPRPIVPAPADRAPAPSAVPEPVVWADSGGPAAPAGRAVSGGPARIVALGAAGEQELRDLAARYRAALARPGGPAADPLLRGAERAALPYRLAVVGAAPGGLAEQLAAPTAIGVVPGGVRPTVAFLFTGQGSQYQRMADVLYRTQPIFRRHLDRCDEILRPHLDRPLLELLYPADGRTRPLDQTIYTQPLTFAVDYALAQLWRAWGVEPDAVLGHSVGEYAAACVAGVFDLDEGLLLIARRARLMQELPSGGGMLAVRADEATVRSHLRAGSGIAVAALNGPTSVVLAGDERQLDAVAASLRQAGVTSVRLGVSHAFHSALMEPVLAPFEECFRHVTLRPPRIPLISNLTGRPAGAEIADPEYWLRQLRQPVRFADGVRWLAADGIAAFLEVGPGTTLAVLARESLGTLGDGRASGAAPLVVSSLARGRDDVEVILAALGQLWVRGAPVAWDAVDGAAAVARGGDGTGGDVAAAPRATANGAGQASSPGGAAPGGAAPVDAAPSTAAPAPTTLFNAEIDHASVSRTLAELRQGRLSMTEALAAIRRGNGSGPSADPAPTDGPLSDGAA